MELIKIIYTTEKHVKYGKMCKDFANNFRQIISDQK